MLSLRCLDIYEQDNNFNNMAAHGLQELVIILNSKSSERGKQCLNGFLISLYA